MNDELTHRQQDEKSQDLLKSIERTFLRCIVSGGRIFQRRAKCLQNLEIYTFVRTDSPVISLDTSSASVDEETIHTTVHACTDTYTHTHTYVRM